MCVQGQCECLRVSVSDCARARDLYYCARERASERASERERERERERNTTLGQVLRSTVIPFNITLNLLLLNIVPSAYAACCCVIVVSGARVSARG